MADKGTIILVFGGIAILGVGAFILIDANRQAIQAQQFMNPNTGQPALQGDAALLYAGLSGGGNFLSGLFRGIGAMNNSRPNQNWQPPPGWAPGAVGNYSWNNSQAIGTGNSPAAFGAVT
jgi:hypothetical protein